MFTLYRSLRGICNELSCGINLMLQTLNLLLSELRPLPLRDFDQVSTRFPHCHTQLVGGMADIMICSL